MTTCECCNKKWQSKSHLARHLNRKYITGEARKPQKVRADKKETVCAHCGHDFRGGFELARHLNPVNGKGVPSCMGPYANRAKRASKA